MTVEECLWPLLQLLHLSPLPRHSLLLLSNTPDQQCCQVVFVQKLSLEIAELTWGDGNPAVCASPGMPRCAGGVCPPVPVLCGWGVGLQENGAGLRHPTVWAHWWAAL